MIMNVTIVHPKKSPKMCVELFLIKTFIISIRLLYYVSLFVIYPVFVEGSNKPCEGI